MISGAGGGGGGKGGSKASQKAPTEQKNSLFSSSYVKVIDLISEGEIYGLFGGTVGDDPLKGVYLGNTPIREPNGTLNFTGVTFDSRNGVQWQSYLPGFDDIQSETIVNTTVTQATPIPRTITNSSVNAVRVTVTVPALQEIKDNGDIQGASINLKIQVQYSGGSYIDMINDTISGRTSQSYQKDYRINLSGAFPVVVRVVRVTADSGSAKLTNAFAWSSYTQITYSKLAYPNSAIVGLRIDSEQFNSIPTRSYRVRGLKVKIPNNGTVNQTTGAITYSGTWNGTFGGAQWTSDPAWCLYDLLTSRYGFKDHISEASLDKWSFYAASQYCAASVSNGLGGTEPRFSCNVNIQTQEDAYKVINDMASVFRAMPYWSTGTLALGQDKPADPAYLFTYVNVEEAGFSYQSSSLKTRPTVAVVQYMDLNAREPNYEVVEDYAGIAKYGVIKTEITAFACTSRGQAYRLGAWLLYAAQNERETVNFTASIQAGIIVRPGQIIEVSDPVKAGARRGGRISTATTTVVTIDDATGIAFASGCTLSVVLSTGLVEVRTVSSVSGTNITVSSAFSSAPSGNSVWIFETPALQSTTWRVLSIQEEDQCKYNITALAYNSSKYNYIERGFALQSRSVSILNDPPDSPVSLTVTETLYTNAEQVRSKVILSWKGIPGTPNYLVKWCKDGGNWITESRESQGFEILDVTPGYFEFAIYSVNFLGISSTTPLTGSLSALGKTAPPANVTGFTVVLDADIGVTLSWNANADLDILSYQILQSENGATSIKLGDFTATSKKLGIPVVGTTTWTIVAQDTSGSFSVTSASASITIGAAVAPTTTGVINGSTFTLNWTAVTGSLATDFYDVRYGTTTNTFASATPLATVKGTTQSVEANWSGVRRFFVAAVDIKGNVGAVASYDAVVTSPSQVTMTQQAIDNNVLLQWSDGGIGATLPIASYELRKGATWATATYIGTKQGRFTTVFESVGATYIYWIAAIDTAGNYGTPSSVNAQVSQPPDYVLKLNVNSTFSGTKTNLALQDGMGLVASVDTAETWQSHFTTRSWTTLQNQVSASPTPFPYYAMPSQNSGQYFEDIDYGTLLVGIKVSATLTSIAIAGATVVTPTIHIRGTGTTAATYSRSLTTVTVTATAHGLTAGRLVFLDFTSGGALDGSYVVLATGLTANAFTVTTVATGTIAAGSTLTFSPWTTYAGVDSVFATNFRYIRVQYDFSSAGGDDLLGLTALNIRLDSKLRNDSGNGTAVSTDTGGTVVSFNYAFIDVDSLSVTPATTSPVIAVYDFVDTPYPTSFKVLLFNTSGTRVSGAFSWSARGT